MIDNFYIYFIYLYVCVTDENSEHDENSEQLKTENGGNDKEHVDDDDDDDDMMKV